VIFLWSHKLVNESRDSEELRELSSRDTPAGQILREKEKTKIIIKNIVELLWQLLAKYRYTYIAYSFHTLVR